MGWMVGQLFFLSLYLVNYLPFFKSVSYRFRMCFKIFFAGKLKKFKNQIFQKFSPKSGVGFFFDFVNINSQISRKQLDIFF